MERWHDMVWRWKCLWAGGAPWGLHSHQATVSGQGGSLEAGGPGDHPSLEVCRDRCSSHTFHYDYGLKIIIDTQ